MTICCAAGCKNRSSLRSKKKATPVPELSNESQTDVKSDVKKVTFYQ